MIEKVTTGEFDFASYKGVIADSLFEDISRKAKSLAHKKIVILNATSEGGGVAEIFQTLIPMMKNLGLSTDWYVFKPPELFFEVSKEIHNFLQGKKGDLTPAQKDLYLRVAEEIATDLYQLKADLWEIHDPQPAGVIGFHPNLHPSIWRCHLDTSKPNRQVWKFLLPFLKEYDRTIFTMRRFIGPGLSYERARIIPPAIDALNEKNRHLPAEKAKEIVEKFGLDPARPLVAQISRFDPWKDPWGVIDSYRIAKKKFPQLQLALVGAMAADDPEAQSVLADTKRYAGEDPDIFILTNLDGVGPMQVNALQRVSDILIQKSHREGFGLTVSEAMWKKKPVIGGRAGGIVEQIVPGRSGFLVTTASQCAEKIVWLLDNPEKAKKMGALGHETVKERFLMPRLLLDHLNLYSELLFRH